MARIERQSWMRRLYLQVYLTIVASLVLVVLTAALLWHFFAGFGPFGQQFEVAGEVIDELVPAANAPAAAQQQAIDRLAERLGADLALFSRTNEPLAAAGRPLPAPSRSGGWMRTAAGPAVSIPLPDHRRLPGRTTAHGTARAAAARSRIPWCRRSHRARQGRGPRRGRPLGSEFQSGRRPHRKPRRRSQDAARQCVP